MCIRDRRHTDQLCETCEFCGEVFKGLKKHLERTGCGGDVPLKKEKIPCPFCPKEMSGRDQLKRHIKTIHDTKSKDKLCPDCDYSTYSNHNLRLHIGSMHGGPRMEKKSCPQCQKSVINLKWHVQTYHNVQGWGICPNIYYLNIQWQDDDFSLAALTKFCTSNNSFKIL